MDVLIDFFLRVSDLCEGEHRYSYILIYVQRVQLTVYLSF
jgi:hypothetical protein